ncbi:MAG: DNA helicase II [Betaproteobacteria bacterium RIFCSPLOWO2_02_FULL_63_19]|nr:MAG: DNA helicase II [Betaproteobacteria bacterium RIFCSPLOWO2_02_FULL_63_19]
MPLLDNLNREQLAAVTLPNQHALILAGAGSGKTRVLTTRIAWLISTGNVSPGGLLAVTFTNKAAREMLTRVSAMLPINTRGMWVGTFHGLCNRLLRAHHRDAGLVQSFQILDSADQLSAVKRALKSMNADEERFPPKQVQYFINAGKEEGKRARDVDIFDEHTRRQADIFAVYDEQCQREGVVDFAELLLRSYELLTRNEILRHHYQSRFRHVLVDEFQDTNRLQYRWLKLLAGDAQSGVEPACVFGVGDDDQSIYRFRGANVGNMADFERDFRVENVIRLEQNYRSHGNILAAANALISNNRDRLGKNLWTAAGEGEPVRIYEAQSDGYEAAWIVEEVQSLFRAGVAWRDMALLYRSNAQSRVLEHALFSNGIAYRVYGGLRFFERVEVKHALAYLRLISNPDDDGAFLRVANFPARGIGARSMEALQNAANAGGTSLYAAVPRVEGKAGAALGSFLRMIEALRAETRNLPLPEVVEHMLERSGLLDHYRGERDGADRVENLAELANAAAAFIQEEESTRGGIDSDTGSADSAFAGSDTSLAAFLAHASLESGENQAGEGADALQLMTVHSAKGLEFHAVFVTGLEEGLFPHEQSTLEDNGLEEERRLMYVAITRARTRLYLSFAQTRLLHGQTRYNVASRFIDEIPPGVTRWTKPRHGAGGMEPAWNASGQRPAAATPATSKAAASGYRIGQSVTHAKFGHGVIVSSEGSGTDARLQVNFGSQGMKWLALEYAKLTPA